MQMTRRQEQLFGPGGGADGPSTVQARSILVRSKIPGADYAINPYVGCAYGCGYCYASFMGRMVGRSRSEWGRYLYPKANLEPVLRKQLRRPGIERASIFIGSVTDPYQPAERRWRLTRTALELLAEHRHQGRVQILTRSPLVTRDVDVLESLDADVGLTITESDGLGRLLDQRSPEVGLRLEALATLNERGVGTFAFVGPLFGHLAHDPRRLDAIFAGVRKAGTRQVYVAHGRLGREGVARWLDLAEPAQRDVIQRCSARPDPARKRRLAAHVRNSVQRHGLVMRTRALIDH